MVQIVIIRLDVVLRTALIEFLKEALMGALSSVAN